MWFDGAHHDNTNTMTKYILIGDGFDGNITCYYDDRGYLVEFALSTWNIKPEDHKHILENMGFLLLDVTMQDWAWKEGFKWRKARIDLSFNRFWVMFGNARNKIQAERLWMKLSDKDAFLVIVNLKGYLRFCKRNPKYTQMYPDTYLRAHTQDNWDKVADWTGSPNGSIAK